MRRAWAIAFVLSVLPLSSAAHPGPLDKNSCHYCKQDCDLYGLQYAEYHCHIGGDRKVNFSYQQFWRLQRLLRRAKNPTLREIARRLREREATHNTIVSSKAEDCWPSIDAASGEERAPLLPRYRSLGQFGELLTAFVCQNPLETVPMLTKELNVEGGLHASLKRAPSPAVRKAFTRSGFSCANPDATVPCTQWELEDELVAATVLKPLISIASQIGNMRCLTCEGESMDSANSSSSTQSQSSSSFTSSNSSGALVEDPVSSISSAGSSEGSSLSGTSSAGLTE